MRTGVGAAAVRAKNAGAARPAAETEAAIAEWVKAIGGKVEIAGGRVRAVDLSTTPVSDEQMAFLTQLSGLERLDLQATQVGDLGAAAVAGLTGLRVLDLSNTTLSDAGLAHVAKMTGLEVVRVAVGRTLLELPAGTLDRVESLEEAARRELGEETGYRAGRMTAAGSFWMSPGILRERMHLFVASDLVAGPQALEPGEQIRTRHVAWAEAVAMCLDGRIEDAKSVAGILLTDARRRLTSPR
jgi:8-oxo-dGTP pyrophosphatase MutT (NUDIX family)